MAQEYVRLTREQRIAALERENVVLRGKMDVLHAMLKRQQELIQEHITQPVPAPGPEESVVTEEGLGSLICQQRFEHLERRLDRLAMGAEERPLRRQAV
jgi:hypothetical protein